MARKLDLDIDELDQHSGVFARRLSELEEVFRNLGSDVHSVGASWKDQKYNEYLGRFEEHSARMKHFLAESESALQNLKEFIVRAREAEQTRL